MKKIYYVISAAMMLVTMSCSNEESSMLDVNEVTAQEQIQLLVSTQDNNIYSTRAHTNLQGNELADYTSVGIFAYRTGYTNAVAGYNGYKNLSVTSAEDLVISEVTYKKLTSSANMFFPLSGDDVDVYAYAPYSASYNDASVTAMSFSVLADQTSDENYIASDFLYGKATADCDGDKTAAVTMYHALTKLTFTIADATNGTDASGLTEIKLTDIYKKVTIDMSKAVNNAAPWLTAWDATPANNHVKTSTSNDDKGDVIVAQSSEQYTTLYNDAAAPGGVSAIIPAQTGMSASAGAQVSVTIDGQTRTAYLGSNLLDSFLPGYEYTYTLNIKSQVLIVAVSIKPWEAGDAQQRDLDF